MADFTVPKNSPPGLTPRNLFLTNPSLDFASLPLRTLLSREPCSPFSTSSDNQRKTSHSLNVVFSKLSKVKFFLRPPSLINVYKYNSGEYKVGAHTHVKMYFLSFRKQMQVRWGIFLYVWECGITFHIHTHIQFSIAEKIFLLEEKCTGFGKILDFITYWRQALVLLIPLNFTSNNISLPCCLENFFLRKINDFPKRFGQ